MKGSSGQESSRSTPQEFRDEHEAWKEIVHKTAKEYLEKLANSIKEFSKSKLKKLTMMEGYLKILLVIKEYTETF